MSDGAGEERPLALGWRAEIIVAVAITAGSAVLGGAAGLVWDALAVHPSLRAVLRVRETADRQPMGQDMLFAAVTAVAALLAVLLLVVVGRRWSARPRIDRGLGAVIGLLAGGVAGAVIADAVGHTARHAAFARAYQPLAPHLSAFGRLYLQAFDFKLHALGLLAVWPIAALVVHAVAVQLAPRAADVQAAGRPAGAARLDSLAHRAAAD